MPIRFVGSDCTDIFRLRFRGCPSGKNSFKYQNSPTHFHLPLFLEFFWGNLTKVGQNYINNKFAQSGRILPKIANNSRHARRLSRLLKPQINRTMGPPGVNDDGSIFPGKSNPLQTCFFFISIAQWSIEEDDTIMSKVKKGKGKTRGKNAKNHRMCIGARQRIDRQLSKLQFKATFNVCV